MVFTLNDGHQLPKIGFGTWGLKGAEGVAIVKRAIQNGYRLIDTAISYENEGSIGKAILDSGVNRCDMMIVSKLPGRHHRYQSALKAIEESLYRTGLDYFDVYTIQWPNPLEDRYLEAWQALIKAKELGLVRSIGVSNFLREHIERIMKHSDVTPAVNIIECHPFFNQACLRAYHQTHDIATMAWCPLGGGKQLLEDRVLLALSQKYHKSCAQIILRWEIQSGIIPLPQSILDHRQRENLDIFDFVLDEDDMCRICQLSKVFGRIQGHDPSIYQEF